MIWLFTIYLLQDDSSASSDNALGSSVMWLEDALGCSMMNINESSSDELGYSLDLNGSSDSLAENSSFSIRFSTPNKSPREMANINFERVMATPVVTPIQKIVLGMNCLLILYFSLARLQHSCHKMLIMITVQRYSFMSLSKAKICNLFFFRSFSSEVILLCRNVLSYKEGVLCKPYMAI